MDSLDHPFLYGRQIQNFPEVSLNFPKKINRFIEPFTGGGSVYLNTKANEYLLNDIDKEVVSLHKFLITLTLVIEKLFLKKY